MKTIEELKNQDPVFLNDWKNISGLAEDFEDDSIKKENILFATYNYEDYNGDAFILFERNGLLYEVHGWHCSCYGLEKQWEPEETSLDSIAHRLKNGDFGIDWGKNVFRDALINFIGYQNETNQKP